MPIFLYTLDRMSIQYFQYFFIIKIDLTGDKIIDVHTYSTFEQMIWPNGSVKIIQFSAKGQKVNNSLIELRYLLCSRKYDWLAAAMLFLNLFWKRKMYLDNAMVKILFRKSRSKISISYKHRWHCVICCTFLFINYVKT